jgi:preprotein translocase subunit YajC
MDDVNVIIQAISTVGFPIVMCGIMFWFLWKEQESHKGEMLSLKEVISENNKVLEGLKQLIEDKLK